MNTLRTLITLLLFLTLLVNLYAANEPPKSNPKEPEKMNTLNDLYRQQYENLLSGLKERTVHFEHLQQKTLLKMKEHTEYMTKYRTLTPRRPKRAGKIYLQKA